MFIVKGEAVGSGVPRDKRGVPYTTEREDKVVASPAVARSIRKAKKEAAEQPIEVVQPSELTETEREADYQAAQSRVDVGSPAEPGDDTKIAGRFDEPPKDYAAKTEWVDYAVSRGADRDEAEEATKSELIDRYGKEN